LICPPLSRFPLLPESLLFDGGGEDGGGELERDEPPSLPERVRSLLPLLLRSRSRDPLSRVLLPRSREPPLSREPLEESSGGTMRAPPMRSMIRRGTSLPCDESVDVVPLLGGGVEPDGSGSRTRLRHESSLPERDVSGAGVEGSDGVIVEGRSTLGDESTGSLP